jgi:hypothetical protein
MEFFRSLLKHDPISSDRALPPLRRGFAVSAVAVLAAYVALCLGGLAILDQGFDGLWVFYAGGGLALGWVGLGLAVTLGLALLPWRPPTLGPKAARMAGAAGVILALAVALIVLQRFENSADEYAFVFQARTYLAGRLWNPPPPLGQGLAADYTWVSGLKWAGQYPPGWPGLLAAAGLAGVPFWLVNPVLGAALLALLWRLAKGRGGWALAAFALSPFFVFTAASYHSHVAAAVGALLAFALAEAALARRSTVLALGVGAVLGYLGLIRYATAALVALPLVLSLLRSRSGEQGADPRPRLLLAAVAGMVPFGLALLAYHWAITGDPLKPVYWLGGRTVDHLYFDPEGIRRGAEISLWRLVELSEWMSPALLPLYGLALAAKLRARSLTAADWVFPLFVGLYLFYPFDGANRYGPRYLFDAVPFLVLTIATAELGVFGRRLAVLAVVATLCTQPFLWGRYRAIVAERLDVDRQVREKGLDHAVVLVESDPGRIWRMEAGDLARNGIDADGPVLYARGDLVDAASVRRAFPERALWRYVREEGQSRGALFPVP